MQNRAWIGLPRDGPSYCRLPLLLTDTLLLRGTFRAVGFEAVPRFALHYHRDSACRRHRHWMAWHRDAVPPPRLRCEHGDF